MTCGVKYCGGCNPRYARGEALNRIRNHFEGRINFPYAQEGEEYDLLLVICGCTNCCASYDQYSFRLGCLKLWEESQIPQIIEELEKMEQEVRGGKNT